MAVNSNLGDIVPEDVELVRDLEVGYGGDRTLRMDILRPKQCDNKPLPVIVWVYGGAFRKGSKDSGIPRLVRFAQRGYLCASIEYRLSPEAKFPAQIHDCKLAIRYLRAHANQWGLDPERIGAWGESAGGHLVAMLGTSSDVPDLEGDGGWADYSSRVQAVCDGYGPTNFLEMDRAGSEQVHDAPDSPESEPIGGPIQEHPDLVARANPITYVRPGMPPFLIMHGDRDPLVPFNQSQLLDAALQKAGADARFVRMPGAGHGGLEFQSEESLRLVEEFFDRYLAAH